MSGVSPKRPLVAALLGAAVTGLGHVYLREWGRALTWYALTVCVAVLFVPTAALERLAAGEVQSLAAFAPVLAVVAASVVDAYRSATRVDAGEEGDADVRRCPECGRTSDDALQFCHWCATDRSA